MAIIQAWPGSADRWQRARRTLGAGVSTGLRAGVKPHPLYFTHGSGCVLHDVDGNSYLDYVLGWGPVILGHSHPALVAAVGRQLPLGQTFGACHDLEYEVAELVCAAAPWVERVLWSNTGSEAVQTALRLARAATGRGRFVKFEGHYHGWTDPFLLAYRPDAQGNLDGPGSLGQQPQPGTAVLPWGDIDSITATLTDPDNDIAAVLTEPALCNSGVIFAPDGYLAALRELCDRTGTLLIFDEVITGFRIAYGGAAAYFGVRPDLAVYAKAIAGGFPLAAIGGRADLIDQVAAGVVHAGTYNGNPIVLSAASATLAELARDGTYQRFEELGSRLARGFRKVFDQNGIAAAVNQIGPVVQCAPGISRLGDFRDFLSVDWTVYDEIAVELLRRGIYVLPGGRWYLSTTHTEDDIDRTLQALDDSLRAVSNTLA